LANETSIWQNIIISQKAYFVDQHTGRAAILKVAASLIFRIPKSLAEGPTQLDICGKGADNGVNSGSSNWVCAD
jgi:hypothetical protein